MPLILVRKDITAMAVDAIVNAANETLLGGGGVDGAIHAAAGPMLLEECRRLGGCRPGEAKLTLGYRLPARYVIHTVGPRWQGGGAGEEETLRACYRNSLALARDKGCETVAFPLISAGIFGYPKAEALAAAEEEIRRFLRDEDMTVYLTIFGRGTLERDRYPELEALLAPPPPPFLASRIDLPPADTPPAAATEAGAAPAPREKKAKPAKPLQKLSRLRPLKRKEQSFRDEGAAAALSINYSAAEASDVGLEEALAALDESFSRMLLRKITEKGMTDAQCYKKANIDRKLFSKIRSDEHYRPSKPTVLAFAVALELGLGETKEMLMKAGFALSRSSEFDVIVEYFIQRGQYDIDRINEALFAFDQTLLGSM
ncbi:MAG: macro domain-containing protein [Oscillospiraceae bacterium]|nr:macro domain-containing protein [Oscillospiraceae bacterium]